MSAKQVHREVAAQPSPVWMRSCVCECKGHTPRATQEEPGIQLQVVSEELHVVYDVTSGLLRAIC